MRNQAGFTLQEVMITIAIAGIVSAIAVPNYLGWMPRHRLESGTSDVVMALNAARLEAIKGNTDVTVNFDPSNERYTVVRNGTTIHQDRVPEGVDLKTVYRSMTTTVQNTISFNSRGFPDQDVDITLENNSNQSHVIRLSLTGSTRVD
ncbi:MAG TPA: GspH/FimT family pseudopilin [Desulfobacterales bacterium]